MADWDTLKNFFGGMVVRWVLKIGGGFLLNLGISEKSVAEVVGAGVAILVGLLISLFQHKKAIETPVPK